MADGVVMFPHGMHETTVFAVAFVATFERCAPDEYGRHAALVAASHVFEQYRLACFEEQARRAEKKGARDGQTSAF